MVKFAGWRYEVSERTGNLSSRTPRDLTRAPDLSVTIGSCDSDIHIYVCPVYPQTHLISRDSLSFSIRLYESFIIPAETSRLPENFLSRSMETCSCLGVRSSIRELDFFLAAGVKKKGKCFFFRNEKSKLFWQFFQQIFYTFYQLDFSLIKINVFQHFWSWGYKFNVWSSL